MHKSMERLYEAAAAQGIVGQSKLARALGETPQTVKNWESRGVSQAGLLKAQNEFQYNANWIATGSENREVSSLAGDKVSENNLATRIRVSRSKVGLTQMTLGNIVGLDQTVLSKMECGTVSETTKIAELARALKVDAYWLATGKGSKEQTTQQMVSVDNKILDPILVDLDALLPEDADIWRVQIRAAAIKARRTPK